MFSPGEQLLDLVYVDDVIAAYLQAAELLAGLPSGLAASYHVRSGRLLSLRQIVDIFQTVTQREIAIEWGSRPYRKGEVMNPWPGPMLPSWSAQVTLEEGIRRSLEGARRV